MSGTGIAEMHNNNHFVNVNKMDDLVPLLKKRAGGRTISGLNAYE